MVVETELNHKITIGTTWKRGLSCVVGLPRKTLRVVQDKKVMSLERSLRCRVSHFGFRECYQKFRDLVSYRLTPGTRLRSDD